jgi:1,4-alpha-glucan branching enzyme
MHPCSREGKRGLVVRAFLQDVKHCEVADLRKGDRWTMTQIDPEGFYEVFIPRRRKIFRYELLLTISKGSVRHISDPYACLPSIGEQDLYLFNEGNEHRIYDKLGAHLRTFEGSEGVSFAVWAPSAAQISLVGNFNKWDGRYHPMRFLGASGVWELFVPGLVEGELYKFQIRDQKGNTQTKTDPYGTHFESPPSNASIVCNVRKYQWNDEAWLKRRHSKAGKLDQPISVYEVHLASWRRNADEGDRILTYRELAPQLADYALELGFTHIEVMPVAEHPFDGSWGYQVTGFYAPTERFGSPGDFAWFVDHLHQKGIGVIVDWVPAHFPRDAFALAGFDGTHLYEHADPRKGAHMDWGTLIFNYGRNEVRNFLTANALAWLDRYHIDGLRVDAVASMLYLDYSRKAGEWIPNQFGGRENLEAIDFLRGTNELVHQYYPGVIMIAEESTSFPGVSRPVKSGGLGFDYKWNMGWMHDTLSYFSKESVHRKWHQSELTFGMLYQYAENFVTVLSHDEVVHGKASMLFKMGAWHIPEKAANLRALYAHMWAWPGKKLLFMGSEFAQSHEWDHGKSLDWHLCNYPDHEGVRRLVGDLNRLYTSESALGCNDLNPKGFQWLACYDNEASVVAYLRLNESNREMLAVIGHFTPVVRQNYRVGVPEAGLWREVVNTNSEYYGGSGLGNDGSRRTEQISADGHGQSLKLTLPPYSTLIFKWMG